ncbi:MAG: hypothetical protein AMJ79_07710 [Phycisphaerae bacterium SM23_30]|nr:MAG: hypothetical protein AMJ79_07710 [Phycisphaerae bacterium SM23_30]
MFFTIYRYIFRDLLKSFFLAALVLSVVLGLGVMLRPLRQFSVDPVQVPKLIMYTFPITLTMVIPIAALLSATLNYGRLAHFNEINACRTSGIKLITLIYPAGAFAVLVGLTTLLMAFHVMPSFAKRFERAITADAEAIIFRNIQKRGDLGDMFPDIRIYADHALPEEHRLTGVALVQLNRRKIDWIMTAEQVVLDFKMDQPQKQILMHLHGATVMVEDQTAVISQPQQFSIRAPSLWQDDIKFKKMAELRAIEKDMVQFGPIDKSLGEIQHQYKWERLFENCNQQARGPGNIIDLRAGGDRLRIIAQSCVLQIPSSRSDQKDPDKNRTALLTGVNQGPVEVIFPYGTNNLNQQRIYRAQKAWLSNNPLFGDSLPMLIMEQVEWGGREQTSKHFLLSEEIAPVEFPLELEDEARAITLKQVCAAETLTRLRSPSPYLGILHQDIIDDCAELATEIRVEKHSRLAFGVSCVVLVILGTVLGIVFRSGHLLTAFGVSFIPAALCLITIFTGKHIAEKSATDITGILFLWSGIGAVLLADIFIYKSLAKR